MKYDYGAKINIVLNCIKNNDKTAIFEQDC